MLCIIIRHEDAIPDFEAVLKLNKDMAVAHTNLGLIYMLKMENYHRYPYISGFGVGRVGKAVGKLTLEMDLNTDLNQ